MTLKGRDFLTLQDFTNEEIWTLLKKTHTLKKDLKGNRTHTNLKGKQVALIFEKPSTRTRISFEVAINQLGGFPIPLSWGELQLGRGESVPDTARVLERYVDAIVARVRSHKTLEALADYSSVPVLNALSDMYHPCQALSDLFTAWERFGKLEGLKWSYVGDGNNVCHSLLIACSKLGIDISIATPPKYEPNSSVLKKARGNANKQGSKILLYHAPNEAVVDADVVYTDVWVSMGMEREEAQRRKAFKRFIVDRRLLSKANDAAVVMHCLPAHRGVEITDDVMDGKQSVVWQQAENRLHGQKALLSLIL